MNIWGRGRGWGVRGEWVGAAVWGGTVPSAEQGHGEKDASCGVRSIFVHPFFFSPKKINFYFFLPYTSNSSQKVDFFFYFNHKVCFFFCLQVHSLLFLLRRRCRSRELKQKPSGAWRDDPQGKVGVNRPAAKFRPLLLRLSLQLLGWAEGGG